MDGRVEFHCKGEIWLRRKEKGSKNQEKGKQKNQ